MRFPVFFQMACDDAVMFAQTFLHHGFAVVAAALIFTGTIAAEVFAYRRRNLRYAWREAILSLTVASIGRATHGISLLVLGALYGLLWQHRLWTLPVQGVAAFAISLIGIEFAYYWMHRASHRVAWMWATHSVHHSAEQLNFPAAFRLGATGLLSFEWLPFAALIFFTGIPPKTVLTLLALDLLYQFFLHSEVLPRIDSRQWIFNTPSDHRVHHAINPPYIDRNFGGMLIVFDRMFGTYAAERIEEPPRYGLLAERRVANPFVILVGGWTRLFGRIHSATNARSRLRVIFGPPD